MPVESNNRVYRFGVYEADLGEGTLTKSGTRVRLQEQPFQILAMLLDRPGQVVTREELRQRLWSGDTFVEFDDGLNTAIRKLRAALNDSADNPRFLETIPRRGYRFLAPVTPPVVAATATSTINALPTQGMPPVAEQVTGSSRPSHWASKRAHMWPYVLAMSIIVVVASAVVIFWSVGRFGGPKLNPGDRVLVADFQNSTGDASFDSTLLPALRVKMEESPYLSVVSQGSLLQVIKASGKDASGPVSAQAARDACAPAGAKAVVAGMISAAGGRYRVRLEARRCGDAKLLASADAEASSASGVLQSLSEVTTVLRRRLGESATSVAQFDTPLSQATTSSLAALKAFSMGEDKRAQGQDIETASYYKMAVDLDPNFALAYGRLGAIYSNAEEFELGRQYYQKAFDLREHATERERLYLTTHYYNSVTGEYDKAIQGFEIWRQLYPNDLIPNNNLADVLIIMGQPEKAIAPAQNAVRISPNNGFPYSILMQAHLRSGHTAEAIADYQEAVSKNLDGVIMHVLRFDIAFEQHDAAEMQKQEDWAHGTPREGEMLDAAGLAALALGQAQRARSIFARAVEVASNNKLPEYAALATLDEAQYEADLGLTGQSRQDVLAALRLAPRSNDVQVWASIVLARIGDADRANDLAGRASAAAPLDTLVQRMELPAEKGLVLLSKKNPQGALGELEPARAYDFSRATALMNIYFRGLADLEARRPEAAAEEFQRLIDHKDVQPNCPYISMAQLGLARAYALAAKSVPASDSPAAHARAIDAYRTFLDLFKNADPTLPLLQQAKAEYGQLQSSQN